MSDSKDTNASKIKNVSFSKLEPKGFVDTKRLDISINYLKQLYKYILELVEIRDSPNSLPQVYIDKINQYEDKFMIWIMTIENVVIGKPEEIAKEKNGYLDSIDKFYSDSFIIKRGHTSQKDGILLEYYSMIKAIHDSSTEIIDDAKKKQEMLSKAHLDAMDEVEKIRADANSSKTIIEELKKTVSTQAVSDYAIVFEKEAKKNRINAGIWLSIGIILTIVFISSFIYENVCDIFPTEIINKTTNELVRYDYTNLLTKLILIAIQIFLISFSFKQYSINRHLQTLNTHRQNALNSYKLFTESIIGDDHSSRNVLMIQVAKAIYEYSQSTGFLSDKGQNVNSGIVELTKIIGENKP